MSKPTATRTLTVALVLCLVCSVLVSVAAVGLKPKQQENRLLDRNKNILVAAGMYDSSMGKADIAKRFEQFKVRLVDLRGGRFATDGELAAAGIDPLTYDQRQAAKDPALSVSLRGDDPAGIQRLARYATVYQLARESAVDLLVLPVYGYGLWGTLHGFLVIEGDFNTVRGLSFYEHKETPGLGAKVDNDAWKAQWRGKQAYDENGQVALQMVKGRASNSNEIDGLSGATLTTRGVDKLIKFWIGERGFGPFLQHLKAGES